MIYALKHTIQLDLLFLITNILFVYHVHKRYYSNEFINISIKVNSNIHKYIYIVTNRNWTWSLIINFIPFIIV